MAGRIEITMEPTYRGVAPLTSEAAAINDFGQDYSSIPVPKVGWRALQTSLHELADPVQQVLGTAAGHLILVTEQRLDFFSLQSRKVAGSITVPPHTAHYAGADALFEYDRLSRTLTRFSVPDGRVLCQMTLPEGSWPQWLSLGTDQGSPLVLVLGVHPTTPPGTASRTSPPPNQKVVVLDSNTLREDGWTQPAPPAPKDPLRWVFSDIGSENDNRAPALLPSSHNGRFVSSAGGFFTLTPQATFAARYPDPGPGKRFDYSGDLPPRGSISGLIMADRNGNVFLGGVQVRDDSSAQQALLTPCGRYRVVTRVHGGVKAEPIEVCTFENNHPLFRVGRFPLRPVEHVFMAGDQGPLVLLDKEGKHLQLVELNIPELAKEMCPAEFHVTSQCPPCFADGTDFEYQVTVNNPDAVAGYRLRTETPGTSINPTGLFRHAGPDQVTAPTRLTFSVEITGKDGRVVLHQIPVIALPASPPATVPPAEPASPDSPPASKE